MEPLFYISGGSEPQIIKAQQLERDEDFGDRHSYIVRKGWWMITYQGEEHIFDQFMSDKTFKAIFKRGVG